MKRILLISVLALLGFCSREASAQNSFVADTSPDVFSPICKYIQTGDSDKLSAWFADNLELDVGTLDAGGEQFRIILYVKTNEGRSYIQHLKVERE